MSWQRQRKTNSVSPTRGWLANDSQRGAVLMSEKFLDLSAPAIVEGILAKSTKRHPHPSAWGPASVVLISTNGCSLNTNHPLWWRDRPLNNILATFLWPVKTAWAALLGLRQCRGTISLIEICAGSCLKGSRFYLRNALSMGIHF